MRDVRLAPSVLVGVDGSQTALRAAVWAVDEAISRDIPLRLLCVIDSKDLSGVEGEHIQFASARAVLYAAQRAVDALGESVKVEMEVLVGRPITVLACEARSAAMVCVGSIGAKRVRQACTSVASVLPSVALSPVAVIHQPPRRPPAADGMGSIVVEVDNGVVLRHAFEEARLREAPLRVIAAWRAEACDDNVAEGNRMAEARVNRRLDGWKRLYPDVQVESVGVCGDICRYLTDNIGAVGLFVVGAQRVRCDSNSLSHLGCSVLTVGRKHA